MSNNNSYPPEFNWKFSDYCNEKRSEILRLQVQVQDVKGEDLTRCKDYEPEDFNEGEVKANLQLAIRHLEDARMRLGKAIQHFSGGESIYDKTDHSGEDKNG